jgi:excisionase family DNA binding protein
MRAPRDFYTPDEVAERLDLHVRTVRRFIREGKLKAVRIGKQYRIASRDLDDFVGADERRDSPSRDSRRRRVIVSTAVDIEAISPEQSYRIATMLTGTFNAARDESPGKRLDCIYYEELGRLRIVINADLDFASAVLGMIRGWVPGEQDE